MSALDLEAVYATLVPRAVAAFNSNGDFPPELYVVTLEPDEGHIEAIAALPPALTMQLQANEQSKDTMMAFIAALLVEHSPMRKGILNAGLPRPDVVVHLTEAWCVKGAGNRDVTSGPLSEHPERGEALFVAIHTAFGTHSWTMPVAPQSRQIELIAFADSNVQFGGRMQLSEWLAEGSDGPGPAAH